MKTCMEIGRSISVIQRLKRIYLDRELCSFQIGSGQHFFLLRIKDNPGLSLQELAALGVYDKATSTRAVKRLEEEGYVRTERDEEDKRIRHIYTTDKANPVIAETIRVLRDWDEIVLKDLGGETRKELERLILLMAGNAEQYMKEHKGKESEK